ncbi:hypothetical protein MaudMau93_000235 [Microsporum audouinii]
MDQLTRHLLQKEVDKFIDSIEPSLVCKLASSLHPEKKQCQIFSDPKKGSFNITFPVEFTDQTPNAVSAHSPERWVIRIPLLPRLAFPEEKMRGEIATMKYIAEKTTIPIPRIFGYSIKQDSLLGFPFLAMEYIAGKTLHGTMVPDLAEELRLHLFDQLADIYIQLHGQQFNHVGALTLDSNDEKWVFQHNRPLSIELNDQELSGMKSSKIIPPHQTYYSTVDYAYAILKLVFNDFYLGRDSVSSEEDARYYLYGIFASQEIVMEWVDQKSNHGPFILMHGDLRPPNIFVDDNLNIISVIDWEWSHTVPPQMFLPPSWITGHELPTATKRPHSFFFTTDVFLFGLTASKRENKHYNPDKKPEVFLPLTMLWNKHLTSDRMYVAYALLKPCYLGNVYWNYLDKRYCGEDSDKRVEKFFQLQLRNLQVGDVRKVLSNLEAFRKELALAGLEPTKSTSASTAEPAKTRDPDVTPTNVTIRRTRSDPSTTGLLLVQESICPRAGTMGMMDDQEAELSEEDQALLDPHAFWTKFGQFDTLLHFLAPITSDMTDAA